MKSLFKSALVLGLVALFAADAYAQGAVSVPFTSARWTIAGTDRELVLYKGFEALRLQGASAVLDDVEFRTGTIEFDIAFPLERGFQGVRFRIADQENFEEFYLRSHLSGKPDANQYNPIRAGIASWQLFHGDRYSAPTRYRDRDWMHVRIVVGDEYGDVYIDSTEPVLTFKLKAALDAGGLSVYTSALIPSYFANFTYRLADESVRGSFTEFEESDPGTVLRWAVSDPIEEEQLTGSTDLDSNLTSGLQWTVLDAEENGITNLALAAVGKAGTTMLARVRIDTEEERIAPVTFGYSDRVRVFLNGRLLYSGDNGYVTRDYRYLGTIGYFDELHLALREGENELIFAVSESFGGWGVMAKFTDMEGLNVDAASVRN